MRFFALLALAVFAGIGGAQAQTYPSRPITLVVPFPPGGVADTVARPVAEAMGRALLQPIVIENKPGAGGGIGMAQIAKAKPDGYTILLSLASLTVLPEADKILGREPMYQINQLKPIARFTADPTVFAVRADAPWKTLDEFIADGGALHHFVGGVGLAFEHGVGHGLGVQGLDVRAAPERRAVDAASHRDLHVRIGRCQRAEAALHLGGGFEVAHAQIDLCGAVLGDDVDASTAADQADIGGDPPLVVGEALDR